MKNFPLVALIILFSSIACAETRPQWNERTQSLWKKLYNISYKTQESKTILGLQNAYTEGKNWSFDFKKAPTSYLPPSDIERISQHKVKMVGYDFDQIGHWNIDHITNWIKMHDELGGVTTLSWHMKNPNFETKDNSSTSLSPNSISAIFSNPHIQKKFNQELDRLVSFLHKLEGTPVIFRPYHEHNESWFWWGKDHNSVDWYTHLWKYTIDYLRNNKLQNILIAYSPNKVTSDYLERYPGNNYVDIIGTDYYFTTDYLGFGLEAWKKSVIKIQGYAKMLNKIPAITEFGNDGLVIENFWTDYLAWPIQKEGIRQYLQSTQIQQEPINFAYVMLWRNASENKNHFFAPFPGHEMNHNFFQLLAKNFLIFIR